MINIAWIIIGVLGGGILVYLFLNKKKENKTDDNVGLQLILQQLNELSRTVDMKIGDTSKQMNESLKFHSSESNKIIRDVTERLTRLDETNKQVISFTDQLESLQNILKNPKQRGILGEYYLETLLKNVMPPGSFEMQYKLGKNDNGDDLIPDAVIFIKEKIIPVDSKFSLENYNRIIDERNPVEKERLEKVFENDLKNRIVETSKYIRPELNTMNFAFMFIPHEAIYYDLLIGRVGKGEDENLIQRAANKYKVIIVSPTSFLAYLQTVLQGLNALKIEKDAVEIKKRVGELGTHLKSYEEYHNKLGNALGTVFNHYTSSGKELKKIDKDVLRISGTSPDISVLEIEKPSLED
ncbi:MAG: DNA recombination protein RmuC [Candidatus Nomurabacteria bacterium]|nr:DNA recombination protein RmuC [Candidatus Nomurabacteria bacterium]